MGLEVVQEEAEPIGTPISWTEAAPASASSPDAASPEEAADVADVIAIVKGSVPGLADGFVLAGLRHFQGELAMNRLAVSDTPKSRLVQALLEDQLPPELSALTFRFGPPEAKLPRKGTYIDCPFGVRGELPAEALGAKYDIFAQRWCDPRLPFRTAP